MLSLTLATGCGGCDDDDDTVDARPIDARVVADAQPDAVPPDADTTDAAPSSLRSATIAVTEVAVSNDLSAYGIPVLSGAGVSITYTDLTQPTTAPTYGTAPVAIGSCAVWVYDVGDPTPTYVDEGTVSITGANGIVGQCTFNPTAGEYICAAGGGALPVGAEIAIRDLSAFGLGTKPVLVVPGADFTALNPRGMYVNIGGFTNASNNGAFAVIAWAAPIGVDTLVIANTAPVPETLAAAGSYALLTGVAPIPGGFNFLDDGTKDVVVTKAAGAVAPAFTATMHSSGDGLTLATDSADPDAVPNAEADVTFSCDDANGGNCGNNGGTIVGWVLSGSTTDNLTGAVLPIDMPAPTTQWAEFQCKGSPGVKTITLPAAAMTAILGTSPLRMQTRLLRISADLTSDASGITSLVVGHGIVGVTTF